MVSAVLQDEEERPFQYPDMGGGPIFPLRVNTPFGGGMGPMATGGPRSTTDAQQPAASHDKPGSRQRRQFTSQSPAAAGSRTGSASSNMSYYTATSPSRPGSRSSSRSSSPSGQRPTSKGHTKQHHRKKTQRRGSSNSTRSKKSNKKDKGKHSNTARGFAAETSGNLTETDHNRRRSPRRCPQARTIHKKAVARREQWKNSQRKHHGHIDKHTGPSEQDKPSTGQPTRVCRTPNHAGCDTRTGCKS
eukprot:2528263-Rhodomonas_salina.4